MQIGHSVVWARLVVLVIAACITSPASFVQQGCGRCDRPRRAAQAFSTAKAARAALKRILASVIAGYLLEHTFTQLHPITLPWQDHSSALTIDRLQCGRRQGGAQASATTRAFRMVGSVGCGCVINGTPTHSPRVRAARCPAPRET